MKGWHRISRAEALAHAEAEADGRCLICRLLAGVDPSLVLAETPLATLVLTRLPVRPGHLLVLPRAHVVRVSACSAEAWTDTMSLARRGAAALERELEPSRVYVASLGTALAGLPQTSPHLHVHVVPVMSAHARPRTVLTWQNGVYAAASEAWAELAARLRAALPE